MNKAVCGSGFQNWISAVSRQGGDSMHFSHQTRENRFQHGM
jgi:hypothetical protein